MSSRRTRRARRQSAQGNPSPENSPQAARIDALLDPIRKIDLSGIEDERARAITALLLNLVEDLRGELKKAHQENAYLRERLGLGRSGEGKPVTSPRVRQHRRRIRRRKSGRSPKSEPSGPNSVRFRSTGK
jgi:hypothetical protein